MLLIDLKTGVAVRRQVQTRTSIPSLPCEECAQGECRIQGGISVGARLCIELACPSKAIQGIEKALHVLLNVQKPTYHVRN